ncbi:GSCOCG00007384001-RA-CDS [Cotesia congregata]|uniref:PAX-interacting protein 1 n=1 Tax=Cotesia congregata TaxID=51543 RepID=A0A8J2HBG0_COTCN|nr:GSCOCG00007384001-RA-CDS [Cotesia congregata]CAG5088546.1 Similar to MDC1: Mediator of DNA damage checkpoint protein 1 (Macaca mulatta) [Cotesia congregata]
MSRESVNNTSQSNITLITLSDNEDNDDDDEVKIIDHKENVSTVTDEDIKVVFEKDRVFSVLKTVELQTIDDTKSDVSFGTSSLIESPVKLNNTLTPESPETIEVKIIKENITIRILETPEKVKTIIEDKKIASSLETLKEVKPEIREEKITNLLERLEKFKREIKEEETQKSREKIQKVKPEIKEEKNTKPIETLQKVKPEIKEEKVTKPIETPKKVKPEIKQEKIKNSPESNQKVKTDVKENIDKNIKTNNDTKKVVLELENPTVGANKRKKLNCDEQDNVLREIKPENVKEEQKFNYKSHSNCVINPQNKKFKNDFKLNEKDDMKSDTLSRRNDLEYSSTLKSENTSSKSQSSKKPMKIMFTGVNYQEYEKPLSEIGGIIVTNASTAEILVTDQIRRKLKFTLAIARGIPIVSVKWIKTSLESKKFQNPLSYIIKDIRFEREYSFDLRDSLLKRRKNSIFEDYTFIITRNVHPKFSDLSDLIEASGGRILVNAPKTWRDHTFIVSCEHDLSSARRKKLNSPRKSIIPIVETSFIIDSIWKQRINIKDHLLSY